MSTTNPNIIPSAKIPNIVLNEMMTCLNYHLCLLIELLFWVSQHNNIFDISPLHGFLFLTVDN